MGVTRLVVRQVEGEELESSKHLVPISLAMGRNDI